MKGNSCGKNRSFCPLQSTHHVTHAGKKKQRRPRNGSKLGGGWAWRGYILLRHVIFPSFQKKKKKRNVASTLLLLSLPRPRYCSFKIVDDHPSPFRLHFISKHSHPPPIQEPIFVVYTNTTNGVIQGVRITHGYDPPANQPHPKIDKSP